MFAISLVCALVASDESPSISQIRDSYREQITALDTFSVEFTLTSFAPASTPPDPSSWSEPKSETLGRSFYWQQQGRRFYTEYNLSGDVSLWATFDGVRGISCQQHNGPGERYVAKVSIAPSMPPLTEQAIPWRLLGLKVTGTTATLFELLDRSEAQIVGREEVTGVDCWKVDLGLVPGVSGPALNHVAVCLDPVAHWMPRRVTVLPERIVRARAEGAAPGKVWLPGEMVEDLIVHEFQLVPDERLQTSRSFPVKAVSLIGGITQFQASVVTINAPSKLKPFQPEFPFAAEVVDTTRKTVKRWVAGGKSGLQELQRRELEIARASQQAVPPPPIPSRAIDARPRHFPWSVVAISVAFLMFLTAGIRVWRVRFMR